MRNDRFDNFNSERDIPKLPRHLESQTRIARRRDFYNSTNLGAKHRLTKQIYDRFSIGDANLRASVCMEFNPLSLQQLLRQNKSSR
jgi:hypothetical protein